MTLHEAARAHNGAAGAVFSTVEGAPVDIQPFFNVTGEYSTVLTPVHLLAIAYTIGFDHTRPRAVLPTVRAAATGQPITNVSVVAMIGLVDGKHPRGIGSRHKRLIGPLSLLTGES